MFVDAPSNFQECMYYDGINNFYYSYLKNHRSGKNGSSVIVDTKIQENEIFVFVPKNGWITMNIYDYEHVKVFLESL